MRASSALAHALALSEAMLAAGEGHDWERAATLEGEREHALRERFSGASPPLQPGGERDTIAAIIGINITLKELAGREMAGITEQLLVGEQVRRVNQTYGEIDAFSPGGRRGI